MKPHKLTPLEEVLIIKKAVKRFNEQQELLGTHMYLTFDEIFEMVLHDESFRQKWCPELTEAPTRKEDHIH
ncbi:MAG: hypothetical protein AAFX87_05375 [Bacteroidota bacterium]